MTILAISFAPTLGVCLLLWGISVAARDVTVIDGWWGPGIALILLVVLALSEKPGWAAHLLVACVAVWAARLGQHLWRRHRLGHEDRRYAAMREHHGVRFAWVSLGTVFVLQPVIQWLLALPVALAILRSAPHPSVPTLVLGLSVFVAGFAIEWASDRALARHKADPAQAGLPLTTGLFAIVRRPNYLGEIIAWIGIALMAAGAGGGLAACPWPLATPLGVALLLSRVSGVPLMEPHLAATRPGYAEYMARVPAILPTWASLTGRR